MKNMVRKVFIDTDVIIDLLIDRQPHASAATMIFDLAEKNRIKLFASTLCINNVHYICRKVLGDQKTREVIAELASFIEILSVSKKDILNAVNSDFKDFEDAIQYSVALTQKGIKTIVTRNTKDYKHSTLAVFNSETFIKMIQNEG
jgi:predicted nucleic acid-binding protein